MRAALVVAICTPSRAASPVAGRSGGTPWALRDARRYEQRRPEKTPFHKVVSENLESWLAWRKATEQPVPGSVEEELRGSLENRHVHLHACVTDGVFVPAADEAGCDGPPLFVSARPSNQADLAALTERVRRRVIRWFRRMGFLDARTAADMLAWDNSGFPVDASVRITPIDRDVPSTFSESGTSPEIPCPSALRARAALRNS